MRTAIYSFIAVCIGALLALWFIYGERRGDGYMPISDDSAQAWLARIGNTRNMYCLRCGHPFDDTYPYHKVLYSNDGTEGWVAPVLCEGCWSYLTTRQRLPYYRSWHDVMVGHYWISAAQGAVADTSWEKISEAVKADKE